MYGVKLVVGEFGAGKTLATIAYSWRMKKKYGDDLILISNIPLDFVDFIYSSCDDIRFIFQLLIEYINKTNSPDFLPPKKRILFIIDEIHLYFPSASWGSFVKFAKEDLIVLTQCRKRNIEIIAITQELGQVSKRFRVLSPYVRKYYRGFGFYRWYKDFYLKTLDSSDLLNPEVADVVGGGFFFGGWFPFLHFSKSPKWVSYFVLGSENLLTPKKRLEMTEKIFKI